MLKLASQPLSNLQLELLHLYETGISDKHLLELKEVIAKFLFEKLLTKQMKFGKKKAIIRILFKIG